MLRLNNNLIATPPTTPSSERSSAHSAHTEADGRVRVRNGGVHAAAGGARAADEARGDGAPPALGLAAMTSLEVLQLGFNQITEMGALRLHALPCLKILHLQGNELSRVEGLDSLHHLRELVLDRNKIKALEPHSLAALTHLRELRMEEVPHPHLHPRARARTRTPTLSPPAWSGGFALARSLWTAPATPRALPRRQSHWSAHRHESPDPPRPHPLTSPLTPYLAPHPLPRPSTYPHQVSSSRSSG